MKLAKRGEIDSNERAIIISTAHGLKFADFKINYHEGKLQDLKSQFANHPIELPADAQAVSEKLEELLSSR